MKKWIALALSLALTLTLAACGGAQSDVASGSHLEQIKAAGKIVLGTSADYPPFEYHDTSDGDKITGWEIDLAQAIADRLGVELEIKDIGFAALIGDLNAQKVDFVIAAMTIDEKRAKSVDFSVPYWSGGQVLLMRPEDAAGFTGPQDLNGKTIGVQLGTTGEAEAKNIAGATVKPLEKFEGAVLDLMTGRVDAVACDYTVGKNYEINQGLKIVHEMNSEQNGIAFRKGDTELVEAVNEILEQLIAEGAIEQMVSKYSDQLM